MMAEVGRLRFPVERKGLIGGVLNTDRGEGVFQMVNLEGLTGFLGVR